MQFEWDPRKDRANQEKHGISFEQASKLWKESADLLELHDAEHSDDEDRFIGIGSTSGGTLVVVFTEPSEDLVHVLSARPATRRERERLPDYWRGKKV